MSNKVIKINKKQLRKIIEEEYVRGVPEFELRAATQRYIDDVRKLVFRHILITRSNSEAERTNAIESANFALEELEKQSYDLLEDQLWKFINSLS